MDGNKPDPVTSQTLMGCFFLYYVGKVYVIGLVSYRQGVQESGGKKIAIK